MTDDKKNKRIIPIWILGAWMFNIIFISYFAGIGYENYISIKHIGILFGICVSIFLFLHAITIYYNQIKKSMKVKGG